jgi:hypothetical protein
MDYLIKAHPTKYAGVEFRSRLEARWAAFFDLAGWRWDYKPIDFEGWTPDFEISRPEFHPPAIMVEVKPTWEMAHAVIPKIRNSGVQEAMLLANGPAEPWPVGRTASGQTRWKWGRTPDPWDIIAVKRA